ncbi:MAG: hypothetical protein IPL83_02110 [Bdellovibrionales bacterium]|nr:hypothetical protein [Bdellovibrionales bacterium]
MTTDLRGAAVLNKQFPKLAASQPVRAQSNMDARSGFRFDPVAQIERWMEVLVRTHLRRRDNQFVVDRLKNYYHKKYVIKASEIPDSYYAFQQRLALEEGHGHIELDRKAKEQLARHLIRNQTDSINKWIDYFVSSDTDIYPMWIKYWAFNGMVKLGSYDSNSGKFGNRGIGQVAPFAELNREGLAIVIDQIAKKIEPLNVRDQRLVRLFQGTNFGTLYGRAIFSLNGKVTNLTNIRGKWVLFPRNSDAKKLAGSLYGRNTGWCTASETTAKLQLEQGDFHIFMSEDENGNTNIPRIAIRMHGSKVAEVRGVANGQNIDPAIAATPILHDKLNEFGEEADRYKKRLADMKRLTNLYENRAQRPMTMEDLRFLYQVDSQIEGFGHIEGFGNSEDPRISELINGRDKVKDLIKIFGISGALISTNADEALRGGMKIHVGDLKLSDVALGDVVLPELITGSFEARNLKTIHNVTFPLKVKGKVVLPRLNTDISISLLEGGITRELQAGGSTSTRVRIPSAFKGSIQLEAADVKNLEIPADFEGTLIIGEAESVEGLTIPALNYTSHISFGKLKSARGIRISPHFAGILTFINLESANGLVIPNGFQGAFAIYNLTGPLEELVLPNRMAGLSLFGVENGSGLRLPKSVSYLQLSNLKDGTNIDWPDEIDNFLSVPSGFESYVPERLRSTIRPAHGNN